MAILDPILDMVNKLPFVQKSKTNTQASLVIQRLKSIVGPITSTQQQRIRQLTPTQMDALAKAADNFDLPEDLNAWLAGAKR
jgi:hypothetical protein